MIDRCFRRALLPALALAIAGGAAVPAKAEVGVTESTILFGQAAALEGPAAALGIGMREGILAAFAEANRNGGVAGRQLELKSYDAGYAPERAIPPTKPLITQDQVFALNRPVGTSTSTPSPPIAPPPGPPLPSPYP